MGPNQREETRKILEYWYVMEFLSQSSYKVSTNASKIKEKAEAYKNELEKGKPGSRKQIAVFLEPEKSQSLHDAVKEECTSCKMKVWGNITVYLGKVKREACIEQIAAYLQADLSNRPEKNEDDIVIASLQLDSYGRYIPRSFSLSPVVWALREIKSHSGERLSGILSIKNYQEAVEGYEGVFITDEEQTPPSIPDEVPAFAKEAVTLEDLKEVFQQIQKSYMADLPCEETYGFGMVLYQDESVKEKNEEEPYMGLGRSFFSEDLLHVRTRIESEGFNDSEGMGRYLIDYIHSPRQKKSEERHDLVHVDDPDLLEEWLLEIMSVKQAPIGKWPSRYMSALMQQAAVNFATAEDRSGLFGENGPVFSVNGPPGTGKTTLLKEVVANNIIEKARRLAQYEDPDDAFLEHEFRHGDKAQHAYSNFIRRWYSLKDERINDYGILAASSNNAAVENITKELPLESGILSSLQTTEEDDEETKKRLEETAALFRVESSDQTEFLKNEKGQMEEHKEIYFTEYARRLLGKSDVWGLVAAPLGKKSNIGDFYYRVLSPLHWDFYPNGRFKEAREERYAEARKKFLEQLRKVEDLQKRLSRLGEEALEIRRSLRINEETRKKEEKSYGNLMQAHKRLTQEYSKIKEETQRLTKKRDELKKECEPYEKEFEEGKHKLLELQQKEFETRSSVGGLSRIFAPKRWQAANRLADSYQTRAWETQKRQEELNERILTLKQPMQKIEDEIRSKEKELKKREGERKAVSLHMRESQLQIFACKKRLEAATVREARWKEEAERFEREESGKVIHSGSISNILSEDEEKATKAQIMNFWVTPEYNRERERLLHTALRFTKEFVLSSRCCRDNFKTLGQYWGFDVGDDKKRILFHQEDREAMVGALYQTLFLLVPVLSSTFASVGSMFRDVKEKGIIGMLVIDEAGQAQPQMALGALYRSRRALIVGDPRQVEPVVTDDLDLLRKAYQEEIYLPYQDKSLSVQGFADVLNPFGTYLDNGRDEADWVGCPLLVHRRCISPMYDISNRISYGGIMKQQTAPPGDKKRQVFVFDKSQWIQVSGAENGRKDHFVKRQGDKVCQILEIAFSKSEFPDLYIISPFKSVVDGMKEYIKDYVKHDGDSRIGKSPAYENWLDKNIGTVHTFQGKEAGEVIFLLGCDSSKECEGAVRWVKRNIVNVAVTRAKYRLYVVGDDKAWERNDDIRMMKAIMEG